MANGPGAPWRQPKSYLLAQSSLEHDGVTRLLEDVARLSQEVQPTLVASGSGAEALAQYLIDNPDVRVAVEKGDMTIDTHLGSTEHRRRVEGEDIEALEQQYVTLDSGKRVEFESGMVRDIDDGKPRYDLIPILPLRRLADLYARGAKKYGDSNWQLADSDEELQRFKASFLRHAFQALDGETDEDHWAAVLFNAFAIVWLEDKMWPAVVGNVPRSGVDGKS